MKPRWSAVVDAVLIGCVAFLAVAALRSRLPRTNRLSAALWSTLIKESPSIGSDSAPVTLVEFVDYECEVCARFEDAFDSLSTSGNLTVTRVVRQLPLSYHRDARQAAAAAVCAHEVGMFATMHSVMLGAHDSLGTIGFGRLASRAGVSDTAALLACMKTDAVATVVQKDLDLAQKAQITGTPAFVLDRIVLSPMPPESLFARIQRHGR